MRPAPTDPPEIDHLLWDDITHGYSGWDIGANCGQTLGQMTRRFQRVHAFEPAVECRPYLEHWSGKVTIHPLALSDTDGDIQLAALPDKIDTGQLVTPGTQGMEWSPDVPEAVARTIPARRIDTLVHVEDFERPDFCKIDVEGHELRVLRGAQSIIEIYKPQFLIEFHTPDLHRDCGQLLTDAGYEHRTVRHPHYRPGSDMWFQHGWIYTVAS